MSLQELKKNIKNWKLVEVLDEVTVVAEDSVVKSNELLAELKLPLPDSSVGINRAETNIDWNKMPKYHKFFFDLEGWEERIKEWFEKSDLAMSQSIIITYGWEEPMVKVPVKLFLEDWEGFIRSTIWETIIFSEDYKLILEVSRDYNFHSNFQIQPD